MAINVLQCCIIPSWKIQLGWRDFTGFSPRIQQFSSRFRRELLNSLRESSNSRRMFSNSRRRIRRELLILQKITTNREKRKVNLVATENWTILCCDENSYSRWDENWPILCCEENSNSRRDEICPILCCEENSNSRRDEICPVLCCDENSKTRWDENCPILCCDEICPILYNLENMYQAVRGVFFLITSWQCSDKIRKYQGHIETFGRRKKSKSWCVFLRLKQKTCSIIERRTEFWCLGTRDMVPLYFC
jgi:hypothetical protein